MRLMGFSMQQNHTQRIAFVFLVTFYDIQDSHYSDS